MTDGDGHRPSCADGIGGTCDWDGNSISNFKPAPSAGSEELDRILDDIDEHDTYTPVYNQLYDFYHRADVSEATIQDEWARIEGLDTELDRVMGRHYYACAWNIDEYCMGRSEVDKIGGFSDGSAEAFLIELREAGIALVTGAAVKAILTGAKWAGSLARGLTVGTRAAAQKLVGPTFAKLVALGRLPAQKALSGLDDLAARRAALGAPPAGPGVSPTLSRLDIEGMRRPLYGTSGHGRDVTLRVNAISRTHAETDVLQQLANLGGANGARGTMYIDYPPGLCKACGKNGAVLSMARQVGLSELKVVWPGGSKVLVP